MKKIILSLLLLIPLMASAQINKKIQAQRIKTDTLIIYKLKVHIPDTILVVSGDTIYKSPASSIVCDTVSFAYASDTANYSTLSLGSIYSDTSNTLQGWDTLSIQSYVASHSGGAPLDSIPFTRASNIIRAKSSASFLISGTTGNTPASGAGTRLMWIPSKAAFRVGIVNSTQWDDANIGFGSIAMGENVRANGNYGCISMGYNVAAASSYGNIGMGYEINNSGAGSQAIGVFLTNYSDNSQTFGSYLTNNSYSSFITGRYNVGGGTAGGWVASDPLFEVGNGTGTGAGLHNALTIYKNGNVTVDGQLDVNGAEKIHTRAVSTSQTLLANDRMVLASGDITLTAPTITAADSGLMITVKNVGSYTDLVTFSISGNLADSITTARLPRWQTRTIVAGKDGKWYTYEKGSRTDYIYDVSESGSFKNIHEVLAFLAEHMAAPSVIRLGGGSYTLSKTEVINLPYALTLRGFSYLTTKITTTSALANKTAFRCLSNVTFENMQFIATSSTTDLIHYVGSGTYNEIRNFSASGFNIAILDSTKAELWMTEADISNCATAGIKIHSAVDSTRLRITTTDFIKCDKGLWLSKGNRCYIDIDGGCGFRNGTASDSAIVYVPATFTNTVNGYIHGTKWNNIGAFINGFDFTRSDGRDANYYVEDNAGLEDKNPHCKLNVLNNADTTNCITPGQFYKAKFTNTSTYTCKFTMANNRITYQPVNRRDVNGTVSCNVIVNGTNKNIDIALIKNGSTATKYGQMTVRCSTAGQPYPVTTPVYVPDMAAGDYLELWVSCAGTSEIVTVQDVSWYTDTK